MLCPCWTKKIVNRTETIWGKNPKGLQVSLGEHKVKKEDVLICGRKPTVFVRVFYRELHRYRQNEGKHEDLFGLCSDHGIELQEPSTWNEKHIGPRNTGGVSGQRGIVERVEVIGTEEILGLDMNAQVKEDKNLRTIASVKAGIKRTMRQVNTKNLTVDHWRQCFEETLNEWVVEHIQNS